MRTIHKFTLRFTDEQIVFLPQNAEILTLQTQNGQPTIWAEVEDTAPMEKVYIYTYGTGHPMPDLPSGCIRKYLGTIQIDPHGLVFHMYRIHEN